MSSWLYPISSRYYFQVKRGRRVRASYESIRDYVVRGRIQDYEWDVRNNFDKVRPGDELFIYTGDGKRGIIAYADVTGTIPKTRLVKFRFDRAKTAQLLADPVPYALIRPPIPPPRAPLVNLEHRIRQIRTLLPWTAAHRSRASKALSPLNLRPMTVAHARIQGGLRQQKLRHDSILGPVRTYLKAGGFQIGTRSFGQLRPDLVGIRGREVVIVEAKFIERGKGRSEAREGIGQLLEYSWLFRSEQEARFRPHILWLAFSSPPDPRVQDFLASQRIRVSWPSHGGLKLSDPRRVTTR